MTHATHRPWRPLLLAAGLAFTLWTVASPSHAQNYETSWLGNSFSGAPSQTTRQQGTAGLHVQDDIQGMYVAGDGTCYTNSIWDEGGAEAGIYGNAQVAGNCQALHGWGRNGASAISLDDHYVYVAITQSGDDGGNTSNNSSGLPQTPPPNNIWYCVRRYNRAGAPAPFPSANGRGPGYGYDGSMLQVNAGSRKDGSSPYSGQPVSGVAVDADYLYVSDPTAGRIKKYSLATLSSTPAGTWSLPNPGPMVLAGVFGGSCLCVIQNGTSPKVVEYNNSTGSVIGVITFASGVKPSALAFATMSGVPTLLVADQGPDQDIKEYNLTRISGTPTVVASVFGTVGGIYSGKGAQIGKTGPLRFNNPTGVGVDAGGNIYVSQDGTCGNGLGGGGTVLESYAPNRTRNWQLLGLEFVDCADVDPASENDVYTKEEHFVMNYTNASPGTEAAYKGYTVNRLKYPQDPRLHLGTGLEASAWVREYQGHKFLVTIDMYTSYLVISRFNAATDGECAVPSTTFAKSSQKPDGTGWPENQPSSGEWIWRDTNGNGAFDVGEFTQPVGQGNAPSLWGLWVDSNMDVWEATQGGGIRRFACQGLDPHGNPIYSYAHMTTVAMPPQFNDLERIEYYPATDTMYLSGYSTSRPNSSGDWGGVGRVICRYDQWSTNPVLHTGYPIVPPYNSDKSNNLAMFTEAASLSVASQYLFLSYSTQNQVLIYNTGTGSRVGTLVPGASVGGTGVAGGPSVLGWTDIRYGVRAYQRTSGEYEIFNEDDWLGKIVLYRWAPAAQTAKLPPARHNHKRPERAARLDH